MNCITENEFRNAYEALCFANRLGILMNVELTINYSKFGNFTDSEIEQISNRFWQCYLKRDSTQTIEYAKSAGDLAAQRFQYRRFPYINVFERDSLGRLHSHSILAIAPHDKDLFAFWVNNYFGKAFGAEKLLDSTIKLHVGESENPARQWYWFSYMFKTTDPSIKWLKNLGFKFRKGSPMKVRRVSVCNAIGRGKRKADGFTACPHPKEMTADRLWTTRYYDQAVADYLGRVVQQDYEFIANIDRFIPDNEVDGGDDQPH